jgi:hypothetical protein
MSKLTRFALTSLAGMLLAGCFTSKTSLYQGVAPLRPFRDGAVFTSKTGGKTERTTAHEVSPGVYHFISDDSSGKDPDSQDPYRFFPLPSAPAGTLVEEVRTQVSCPSSNPSNGPSNNQPGATTATTCPIFIYGLWRITPRGVEVTNPDCSKVEGVAQMPGVEVDSDGKGSNCGFISRATLEQALRMAAAAHLKPDNIVTLSQ